MNVPKNENEKLTDTANQLAEELNQLQKEVLEEKIRQLEPGRSLADEFSEVNAKVATSTQTEAKYESRGIQASNHETTVPKTQDQGTQAADKSGTFKKVCQAAFLVQLNFQSIWKENIKLRHS